MKWTLIFLIPLTVGLISCGTTNLPPSDHSKTMMKQANQVIIETTNNAAYSFEKFKNYLRLGDYVLRHTNKNFHTLETKNKLATESIGTRIYKRVYINISEIDSTINLTGNFIYPSGKVSKASNSGDKISKIVWGQLVKLAENYPETEEIYYRRN